jgi:uncharacterized cupin superfamily protein
MDEATINDTEAGLVVQTEGWFVLNAAEASWEHIPGTDSGTWCAFESDEEVRQYGIGVHVLMPGQANGRYHSESDQEDFLVLSGECLAIVEGEERRLRQWDLFHCPPGTEHILVGAGDGPCAILMVGARTPGKTIHYPVNEVAARHNASVSQETYDPKAAYADLPRDVIRVRAPWPIDAAQG